MRDTRERLRLLVAIACYGEKNVPLVKKVIERYRAMSLEVDVIVLSEAPKDLGLDTEVVVGVPCKNPWSLPFAHKRLFAQRLERYDLFAYSEDDMEVTQANIEAFLQVAPQLGPGEIAGFLRYETDRNGNWSLPDVHGCYHWKPESVRVRGRHLFAEFTNEHSAFYLLTRSQLGHAIASGGFLRDPYEGRHDMLCAAATDPYTGCGFRKVICLSLLEEFLIHHLSNRYAGQVGLDVSAFKEQIGTLTDIAGGRHTASTLCAVESQMPRLEWSKSYYEPADAVVLESIPTAARSILSIGCGWGASERELIRRGAKVIAFPLDSVIGEAAKRLGVEVIKGSLAECMSQFKGKQFDCVFLSNLLHLLPEPWSVLQGSAAMVKPGGTLVIVNPNFSYLPLLVRRALGLGEVRRLQSFSQSGINSYGERTLAGKLKELGFNAANVRWFNLVCYGSVVRKRRFPRLRKGLGRLMAGDWVLQAQRCLSRETLT